MTEYEREWTTRRGMPSRSRLRIGLVLEAGVPVRFVVQLEYHHEGRWLTVARFDHDASRPAYRDVEQVGLHLDVYDPSGSQIEKKRTWAPQPAEEAIAVAEEYLRERGERMIQRFESWL